MINNNIINNRKKIINNNQKDNDLSKNENNDLSKNENNNLSKNENNDSIYTFIRDAIDFYDKFQPKIQNIINQIEYIKIIDGNNINDEFIFYDINDKEILRSKIETISIFIPQTKIWKWAWSVPFIKYSNTIISRRILDYAFTLNNSTDLILKSTLINSNIIINNQYQIDIYLALSAKLSKMPFIFQFYFYPYSHNENENNNENIKSTEKIYYHKKIVNQSDKNKFISAFLFIVDWKYNL